VRSYLLRICVDVVTGLCMIAVVALEFVFARFISVPSVAVLSALVYCAAMRPLDSGAFGRAAGVPSRAPELSGGSSPGSRVWSTGVRPAVVPWRPVLHGRRRSRSRRPRASTPPVAPSSEGGAFDGNGRLRRGCRSGRGDGARSPGARSPSPRPPVVTASVARSPRSPPRLPFDVIATRISKNLTEWARRRECPRVRLCLPVCSCVLQACSRRT